ncbi:hypothetical protein H4R33_002159 [Dimargaris cristalligena]|nr:hypothetical protein H4R33_002159 [Dimargaris cristalligena]
MSAFASLAIPNIDLGGSFQTWGESLNAIQPPQSEIYTSLLSSSGPTAQPKVNYNELLVAEQIKDQSKPLPPQAPADLEPDSFDNGFNLFNTNDEHFLSEFLDNFDTSDQLNIFDTISPLDISQFDTTFASSVLSKELKEDTLTQSSGSFPLETPPQLANLGGLSLSQGTHHTGFLPPTPNYPAANLFGNLMPNLNFDLSAHHHHRVSHSLGNLPSPTMHMFGAVHGATNPLATHPSLSDLYGTSSTTAPGGYALPTAMRHMGSSHDSTVADAGLRPDSPLPDSSGKRKGPRSMSDRERNPKRKTSLRVSLGRPTGEGLMDSPYLQSDGSLVAVSPAIQSSGSGESGDDTNGSPQPLLATPVSAGVNGGSPKSMTTPSGRSNGKSAKKPARALLTDEQKRNNHIRSEQRRRNLISNYYDSLKEFVYLGKQENMPSKMSKAILLRDSVDYLRRRQQEAVQKRELLATLRHELALKRMS